MTAEQLVRAWKLVKVSSRVAYNLIVIGLIVFLMRWNSQLQLETARHDRNEVVFAKAINAMSSELEIMNSIVLGMPLPEAKPKDEAPVKPKAKHSTESI